jgi:hypothetical protein
VAKSEFDVTMQLIDKRSELIARFVRATKNLPTEMRVAIIFSFMSVECVEECVRFQEKNSND